MKSYVHRLSVLETFPANLAEARPIIVPLEAFYAAPAITPDHAAYPGIVEGAERARKIATFKGDISLPVSENGDIRSAVELLAAAVKSDGVPYPFNRWDRTTIEENKDKFDRILNAKAAYFEVCVGDGQTTRFMLDQLRQQPGAVNYNDIVPSNLQRAREAIGRGDGAPIAADILTDDCWDKIDAWKREQKAQGVQRFVLGMFGVTFNDFTAKQQGYLLRRIGQAADDALISCDHTTSADLLYKYYQHPKMNDMYRVALAWHYPAFKAAAAEFGIRVEASEPNTARQTSEVRFMMRDEGKLYLSTPILKRPITDLVVTARQAGLEIVEQISCREATRRIHEIAHREHAIWHFKPMN